jgi:hypothetical protein
LTVLAIYLNSEKEKKLVDIGCPPIKCAHLVFIFQILDVVTLELGMNVQFSRQIEHTKISAVHQQTIVVYIMHPHFANKPTS